MAKPLEICILQSDLSGIKPQRANGQKEKKDDVERQGDYQRQG
jgi:hypothetical protein